MKEYWSLVVGEKNISKIPLPTGRFWKNQIQVITPKIITKENKTNKNTNHKWNWLWVKSEKSETVLLSWADRSYCRILNPHLHHSHYYFFLLTIVGTFVVLICKFVNDCNEFIIWSQWMSPLFGWQLIVLFMFDVMSSIITQSQRSQME